MSIVTLVRCGDIEAVREAALTAPRAVNTPDESGCTPLMAAVQLGLTDAIRVLVDDGAADPCQASVATGDTPLHFAATRGDPATMLYLIAHGAAPAVNGLGMSPEESARRAQPFTPQHERCQKIYRALLDKGAAMVGVTPEMLESYGGRLGPPPAAHVLPKDAHASLLRGLPSDFIVAHETAKDVVITGLLPYLYRGGGTFSTPIVAYVSKRVLAKEYLSGYQRQRLLQDPLITEAPEACFRCRIDTDQLVTPGSGSGGGADLVINPKAKYIDINSGVIVVPVAEASRHRNVAEFLLATVAELFSTAPPLIRRARGASPSSSTGAGNNGGDPLSSSMSPKPTAISGPRLLQQMALACSRFYNGAALSYRGPIHSILGVIPIAYTASGDDGGAALPPLPPPPKDHPAASRPVGIPGASPGVFIPTPTNSSTSKGAALRVPPAPPSRTPATSGCFAACNYAIPVAIRLPDPLGDITDTPPRVFVLPTTSAPTTAAAAAAAASVSKGPIAAQLRVVAVPYVANVATGEVTTPLLQRWAAAVRDPAQATNLFHALFQELQSLFAHQPPLRMRPANAIAPSSATPAKNTPQRRFGALRRFFSASKGQEKNTGGAAAGGAPQKPPPSKKGGLSADPPPLLPPPKPSSSSSAAGAAAVHRPLLMGLCVACQEEVATVRIRPCAHVALCTSCFDNDFPFIGGADKRGQQQQQCPLCLSSITETEQLFI